MGLQKVSPVAKPFSLLTLTFENTVLMLLMHYSRIMPNAGKHRYFPSTAVFLNELLKLSFSLTFCIYEASQTMAPTAPATVLFQQIFNNVLSHDSWKLAIPAALYTVQNLLQYAAVSNLDPAHYQVLNQLKILSTAVFSVILLKRSLGTRRWISLVLLTVGVAVVSIPPEDPTASLILHDMTDHFFPRSMHELGTMVLDIPGVARELTKRGLGGLGSGGIAAASANFGELVRRSATYQGIQEDVYPQPAMNYGLGVLAVVGAATLSGLTGVYFEKVLKDPTALVGVWTRNVQLSLFSLLPSMLLIVANDGQEVATHGFFTGYNVVVWATIVFHSASGILAALVINYADNILKNFATSFSILITFIFGMAVFGYQPSLSFLAGMAMVLYATYLYSISGRHRGRPPPINVSGFDSRRSLSPFPPSPATAPGGGSVAGSVVRPSHHLMHTRSNSSKFLDVEPLVGVSTSRPASPLNYHPRSARHKASFDE